MEDMRQLREDFDNFFQKTTKDLLPRQRTPATNMYETESKIIITAELPGVQKNNIEIKTNKDSIELNVEDETKTETKDEDTYYVERSNKSFYRKYPLPTYANTEKANATFKNGLLKIEIEKTQDDDTANKLEIN